MPLLKKIQTIAAKTEATIGTAETLAAADGQFNAYDIDIQGEIEVEEREGQGAFNRLAGVAGARGGSFSFKTDIEWDGSATVPVWASTLLPACGFTNSSGVFTPKSEGPGSNVKTLTMGAYEDGRLKTLAGCAGNFRIVLPSGKKAYIEWSFQGVWQDITDTAIIAPTYPSDTVLRFASATVQYDSVDLCVAEASIDAGNEIILRECPDTDAGYKSALIVDRYPTISADPEATLVADDDPYQDWVDGDQAAWSVALDGPSSSTLTISAPAAQIFNIQGSDRGKLLTDDIEWRCNKNGANQNQELSLTFA